MHDLTITRPSSLGCPFFATRSAGVATVCRAARHYFNTPAAAVRALLVLDQFEDERWVVQDTLVQMAVSYGKGKPFTELLSFDETRLHVQEFCLHHQVSPEQLATAMDSAKEDDRR